MRRISYCSSSRSRRSSAPSGSSISTSSGSKTSARGDGHALLLAAGELPGTTPFQPVEPHKPQGAPHPLAPPLRVDAAHLQREREVLPHRHVREQARSSGTPCRCRAAGPEPAAWRARRCGWRPRSGSRSRRASSGRWSCPSRTDPAGSGTRPGGSAGPRSRTTQVRPSKLLPTPLNSTCRSPPDRSSSPMPPLAVSLPASPVSVDGRIRCVEYLASIISERRHRRAGGAPLRSARRP